MRIAFLYRLNPPLNPTEPDADETRDALVALSRALAARGHEVLIFHPGQAASQEGVSLRPVAGLARYAREQALDAFVAVADEQALKLGIPARATLWWSHEDQSPLQDEMPDLRAALSALLATRSDRVIAVSSQQAEQLRTIFALPQAHVSTLPDGSDAVSWDAAAAAWEALIGEDFVSTRQSAAPLSSPFPAPRISVIIPTYNRARNLAYCLASLSLQDEKAFEVIVVDDGSSDDTRAVAESWRDRLNLRYRWQEDLGFRAGEARNLGLQLARGKLILFLDSDLVVPPDFVRAHAEAHARWGRQPVVINSFVWRMLEPDDADLGLPPAEYIPRHQANLKPDSRTRYQLFDRDEPVAETYFLDSNALSMKREDLARVGGFDPEFIGWGHEDTELGYRLANHGIKLAFIRADSYHLYHYAADTKDAERAVNWKRLTVKHGISKWYHPLWELEVGGTVVCHDQPEGLPVLLEAEWQLKTGHAAPAGSQYYRLVVDQGVLKAILPLGQPQINQVKAPE